MENLRGYHIHSSDYFDLIYDYGVRLSKKDMRTQMTHPLNSVSIVFTPEAEFAPDG